MRHKFSLSVLLAGLCTTAILNGSLAQDAYYKNKRLTVLVNFAAGGPTDLEGRLFARHLAKHIDGSPSVIVQNMDGAGGLVGSQYLGEVAPKDGRTLGYLAGTSWQYVSDPSKWRVDLKSYEFIAYQEGATIHYARTDVKPGLKVPGDIMRAQNLVAGGLSVDTSKDLRMRLGLDMLGVPFKYVTGYRSSAPARLALERGEISMLSESPSSYRSLIVPGLVDTGMVIPIWWDDVSTDESPPKQKQMEGLTIPTFPELYKQIKGVMPSGPLWDAYRTIFDVNSTLQRLIALPPSAPKEASEALSRAIVAMNGDKEFEQDAMKVIQFVPEYLTGPDTNAQVRSLLSAPKEMVAFINEYVRKTPDR